MPRWLGRDDQGRVVDFTTETDDMTPPISVGGGGGAVEQTVLSRTVTLTDAEIKSLPGGGHIIVAAPGENKVIAYITGFLVCDTVANTYSYDYDDSPAANVRFTVGSAAVSALIEDQHNLLSSLLQAGDIYSVWMPPGGWAYGPAADISALVVDSPQSLASVVNEPLRLRARNGSGVASTTHFTGGDAANTLKVTVLYSVIDLT